jgi:hypothetical protein
MHDPEPMTFERLREQVAALSPASESDARELVWADEQRSIAIARDPRARIEIFVIGDELEASIRSVRECLVHQRWTASDGSAIDATRVVLPADEHFDGVATLVCAELLRTGVAEDPQRAFTATEPVLALALRRAVVGDEVLAGLIGELVLLEALLRQAPINSAQEILRGWTGHVPSSRDFQLGDIGIEVKTTMLPSSTHAISGVHQVELGRSVGGVAESSLFLLSIGIRWLQPGAPGGTTLPQLVEAIVATLHSEEDVAQFLARVRQYGGEVALGYDHGSQAATPRYQHAVELRFERLYDMTDNRVRVLRSQDLTAFDHVEAASVQFRATLPRQIRGDINPVNGLSSIADAILGMSGYLGGTSPTG